MESQLQAAVDMGEVPGFVVIATDATGEFTYSKSFGRVGIDKEDAMNEDTVIWIASASKLITSVAALQCVERGLLDLDADASDVLLEFKELQVLTGFDAEGKPVLRAPASPVTLRHLLSHSAGFSYDMMSPLLVQYRKWSGVSLQPDGETVKERYFYPILSDPGKGWSYGPATDWAGQMVERVNVGQSLQEYLEKNVLEPLGIKDLTHSLQKRPDMLKRRAYTAMRNEHGAMTTTDNVRWQRDHREVSGGSGMFGSAREYIKILRSVLANDGKLLKPSTMELLFTPTLSAESEAAINATQKIPMLSDAMGGLLPYGVERSHALGGMVLKEDLDGGQWRRKGCLIWSGYPNIYWSIDRASGLACLYFSNVEPAGDKKSIELATLAEKGIYEAFRAAKSGSAHSSHH